MVIHSRLGRFKSFRFASIFISLSAWDTPSPARNLSTAGHPVSARKKKPKYSPSIPSPRLLSGCLCPMAVPVARSSVGRPEL